MSIINTRMNVKNGTSYDTHHLETNEEMVLVNGGTLKNKLLKLDEDIKKFNSYTISVKDFGAKGDGITDDTIAIQKAIDSVGAKFITGNRWSAYQDGGTVFFPRGKYKITKSIRLRPFVRIKGSGRSAFLNNEANTTIIYNNANLQEPCISFVGIVEATGLFYQDLTITQGMMDSGEITQGYYQGLEDITITSETKTHMLGINFSGCPTSYIKNVAVEYFDIGVYGNSQWSSEISDFYPTTNFIGIVLNSVNSIALKNIYCGITPFTKKQSVPSSHIFYSIVNNENLLKKNVACGVLLLDCSDVAINRLIVEDMTNGIQIGGIYDSVSKYVAPVLLEQLHFERNTGYQVILKNANVNINCLGSWTEAENALIKSENSTIFANNIRTVQWRELIECDILTQYEFINCTENRININKSTNKRIANIDFSTYNNETYEKCLSNARNIMVDEKNIRVENQVGTLFNNAVIHNATFNVNNPISSVDVNGINNILLNQHTGLSTIVGLGGGENYQEVTMLCILRGTILSPNDWFKLKNNQSVTLENGNVIKFVKYSGVWYELSRNF